MVGFSALLVVGSRAVVEEMVRSGGDTVDEEAIVKGFSLNFSHGLSSVVGGRPR